MNIMNNGEKNMKRNEIIFAGIIIISYIICSLILKIPLYMHLIFGAILLGAVFIVSVLKLNSKYENEKISKIFRKLSIISIILYFIAFGYEMLLHEPLFSKSAIFIIIIFITEVISWIFKKNND